MKQASWPERLNAVIGEQVQRYRKRCDLRQDQLAAECTRIGLPISRSKIANMENGRARQEGISVAEVQVLALALGVPPLVLIFPVGASEFAEPIPGIELSTWQAAKWFTGEGILDDDATPGQMLLAGDTPLQLARLHDELVTRWLDRQIGFVGDSEAEVEEARRYNAKARIEIAAALRALRDNMRRTGLTPPPLPDDLEPLKEQLEGKTRRQ